MSPHMISVQPPSLELGPFPELLGPPRHFRGLHMLGEGTHFLRKRDRFLTCISLIFLRERAADFSKISSSRVIARAFTPTSAAAERVFSMLKWMFGDLQMEELADIIQTALMLRMNERSVG